MSGEHVTRGVLVVSAASKGQLPRSMGAEFLPIALHSTDWVRAWQAPFCCIPINAEVSPLTCIIQPGPRNLHRIIHTDSRLMGHLEDGHQVWKQRWHNFIMLSAAFFFCCVPRLHGHPLWWPREDSSSWMSRKYLSGPWPPPYSWVVPLRGWQPHTSSCVGSKLWSPSSEQPVGRWGFPWAPPQIP